MLISTYLSKRLSVQNASFLRGILVNHSLAGTHSVHDTVEKYNCKFEYASKYIC